MPEKVKHITGGAKLYEKNKSSILKVLKQAEADLKNVASNIRIRRFLTIEEERNLIEKARNQIIEAKDIINLLYNHIYYEK